MFRDRRAATPALARRFPTLARHWTPVTVGLVLTGWLCVHRSPEGFPLVTGASRTLLAAAFSNQFYAAYLPALDHSVHNQSTPRMKWTNQEVPSSTIRFFAPPRTNDNGTQP